MEVILREDIENLGLTHDLVDVKPGYARNYLIPQGKAVLATPVAKDNLNAILENLAKEQATEIQNAKDILSKLNDVTLKLKAKAGSNGKLFGSINNAKLAEELANQGVEIDKKYIKVPGNNVKRAGSYVANVRLHREVEGELPFEIEADIEKSEVPKVSKKEAKEVKKQEETGGNQKMSIDDVANQALPPSARKKLDTADKPAPGEDLAENTATANSEAVSSGEE